MNFVKPALCLKPKILGQAVDVATLGGGKRRREFVLLLVLSISEVLQPQVYGHPEVFRHGNRRVEAAPTSASSPYTSFFTSSPSASAAVLTALARLPRFLLRHFGNDVVKN